MPARWFALTIIVFWLGMMGWLFYQDVWPQLQSGVPPPYTIDLVDEAGLQRQEHNPKDERPNEVVWVLNPDSQRPLQPEVQARRLGLMLGTSAALYGGTLIPQSPFIVRTWVKYDLADDSFDFHFQLKPIQPQHLGEEPEDPDVVLGRRPPVKKPRPVPHGMKRLERPLHHRQDFGPIKLEELLSSFRVNRAGQLLDTRAYLRFDLEVPGLRIGIQDIKVHLEGEVHEGQFTSQIRTQLPPQLPPLPPYSPAPVAVSYSGSILNPLHPVNRIKGLRPGQSWRMPLIDPLAEALEASAPLLGRKEVRYLTAHVLPEPQLLPNRDPTDKPIYCLVIEYDDEESKPRTWVQVNSGLVLRQEVTQMGKRLVLQRQTIIPEP